LPSLPFSLSSLV